MKPKWFFDILWLVQIRERGGKPLKWPISKMRGISYRQKKRGNMDYLMTIILNELKWKKSKKIVKPVWKEIENMGVH